MTSVFARARPSAAPFFRWSPAPLPRRTSNGSITRRWNASSTPSTTSTSSYSLSESAVPNSSATITPVGTPIPAVAANGLSRARAALWLTSVGLSAAGVYLYMTDTRAAVHRWLVPPMIRLLFPDGEDAHHAGTEILRVLYQLGLHPRDRTDGAAAAAGMGNDLTVTVFAGARADADDGTVLVNPIGISAGLDKDAEIPDALFDLGAGVVEVGGCTPSPQAGNPSPRVFRVPSLDGLVNRYGFNSIGADALATRLRARLLAYARARGLPGGADDVLAGRAGVPVGSLRPGRLLLVQIAKNKATPEHDVEAVAEDYAYCVRRLAPYADVLVVNVSSPNMPGLRELQAVGPLTRILTTVVAEAQQATTAASTTRVPPRVMVKVSPDEDADEQVDGVCEAVWASGVDGIIVGNTTKRRTDLVPPALHLSTTEQRALAETGGFSGPAMFSRTRALVAKYRQRLDAQALLRSGRGVSGSDSDKDSEEATPVTQVTPKTLFASGGLTNGEQALQLLEAGASVAMLYTSLVYGGVGTVTRIKTEMRETIQTCKSTA